MEIRDKIEKIDKALDALSEFEVDCRLCPRDCRVNRKQGETGVCQTGPNASISHALVHFGEEPVLSGYRDCRTDGDKTVLSRCGSGTIFFSGCNLKCVFCQNYQLSWLNQGCEASDEDLALKMLELQEKRALNINLVSPTHQLPAILRALKMAFRRGLELPLVYNSNGYEKAAVLKHLEGIIDIYLPDLKYYSPDVAGKFSGASDYFRQASSAVTEMYLQQPGLDLDGEDIALRGLIIRHLVLPGRVEDSLKILEWVRRNLSPTVCLSLMSQYQPCHQAPPELQRSLRPEEYRRVIEKADELGFENLFLQPEIFKPEEHLVPDFSLSDPFKWK